MPNVSAQGAASDYSTDPIRRTSYRWDVFNWTGELHTVPTDDGYDYVDLNRHVDDRYAREYEDMEQTTVRDVEYLYRLKLITLVSVGVVGFIIVLILIIGMFAGKEERIEDIFTSCRSAPEEEANDDYDQGGSSFELGLLSKSSLYRDHSKPSRVGPKAAAVAVELGLDFNYYNPDLDKAASRPSANTAHTDTALQGALSSGGAPAPERHHRHHHHKRPSLPVLVTPDPASAHPPAPARPDDSAGSGDLFTLAPENNTESIFWERGNDPRRSCTDTNIFRIFR